ncbi:lipoate--protein ligase [Atopobacter sp. AH10]|uniref:lipoate--protein ligase n=1 Tax=Atopobacter sp. AH10 TaxID=2315861 RepID=UPI000EF21695|nr:lipoate--protein ligase [Atopobacter sp. AH10]RLK64210.1 lipoate--protein ligase [Atopobacter sp. AH10]
MYYVNNERKGKKIVDAATNLAIEYFLLNEKHLDEPILLFYTNENAIIIGKNQNTYEEVQQDYIDEHHIEVVRRFSGGGAVYHDMGNVCFCFITDDDGESFRNFAKFTQPVIDALHKMGATGAKLEGRNDLLIDGKKFSGNAMYSNKGRLTAHGTIMYDLDTEVATHALRPKQDKIKSKGIKSIRSRMTNIKPYVNEEYQNMDIFEFRNVLLKNIFGVDSIEEVKQYVLTDEDWERIEAFKAKYTGNPDWNYGANPKFDIHNSKRTTAGQVDFSLNVVNNKIDTVKINGDFFGLGEISDVEDKLLGTPYRRQDLMEVFESVDLKHYFGNVTAEDLTNLILAED